MATQWDFHKATKGHVAGDSITAGTPQGGPWPDEPNGLNDQTAATLGPSPPPALQLSVTSGQLAVAPSAATPKSQVAVSIPRNYWTHYGVGGWTVQNLLDNWVGAIQNYDPDVLLIEVGINDSNGGNPPSTFQTTYGTLLDTVIAWKSAIRIVCLGLLFHGEQYTVGPPAHFVSGLDTNPYDPIIEALCAARPANCIYKKQYDWVLAYEVANNLPPPGNAVIIGDPGPSPDIHPGPLGRRLMGTHALEAINLS